MPSIVQLETAACIFLLRKSAMLKISFQTSKKQCLFNTLQQSDYGLEWKIMRQSVNEAARLHTETRNQAPVRK